MLVVHGTDASVLGVCRKDKLQRRRRYQTKSWDPGAGSTF